MTKSSRKLQFQWWVLEVWVDFVGSPGSSPAVSNTHAMADLRSFFQICKHYINVPKMSSNQPQLDGKAGQPNGSSFFSFQVQVNQFCLTEKLCASLPATNGVRKPEMPTMAPTSFPSKGHEPLKSWNSWSQTSHQSHEVWMTKAFYSQRAWLFSLLRLGRLAKVQNENSLFSN